MARGLWRAGQKDAVETVTSVAVHPLSGDVFVSGEYYLTASTNWQASAGCVCARAPRRTTHSEATMQASMQVSM